MVTSAIDKIQKVEEVKSETDGPLFDSLGPGDMG